jgi:hypothetical protein
MVLGSKYTPLLPSNLIIYFLLIKHMHNRDEVNKRQKKNINKTIYGIVDSGRAIGQKD